MSTAATTSTDKKADKKADTKAAAALVPFWRTLRVHPEFRGLSPKRALERLSTVLSARGPPAAALPSMNSALRIGFHDPDFMPSGAREKVQESNALAPRS